MRPRSQQLPAAQLLLASLLELHDLDLDGERIDDLARRGRDWLALLV